MPCPDYLAAIMSEDSEKRPHPVDDPASVPVGQLQTYEDVDPYSADHRDYVLMQSRVNLMASSQMADVKANLILTLSAIMLQFGLTKVTNHELAGSHVPYWAVVIGSLLTIILCGYSTLPTASFRLRQYGENEPLPKGFSLLFFGSFTRLPLPRFKRMMHDMLSSPPRTHDAILDELYGHGQYIQRKKYLPLRLAYIAFLSTWVVSAVLYVTLGGVD